MSALAAGKMLVLTSLPLVYWLIGIMLTYSSTCKAEGVIEFTRFACWIPEANCTCFVDDGWVSWLYTIEMPLFWRTAAPASTSSYRRINILKSFDWIS